MDASDDPVLRQCLLTDAKAYEASKWFIRAKQRLEKQEKKIRIRILWHQLMRQSMLKNNAPESFRPLRNSRGRLTDLQLKWRRFAALVLMSKRARDRLQLLKEYDTLKRIRPDSQTERARKLWRYLINSYRIANVVRRIKYARSLRGRQRWHALAQRLKRKSMFESFNDLRSQTETEPTSTFFHSSIAVQASGNDESENYSRWRSFSDRVNWRKARAQLVTDADELRRKRRNKALKNSWQELTKRLHRLRETEDLSVSADRLQSAKDMWQSMTEPYRRKKQKDRLTEESDRIHTRRHLKRVWRDLKTTLTLSAIHTNIRRQIQAKQATKVGVEFLSNRLPSLEQFVAQQITPKVANFRRTIPAAFWHDADIAGYTLTRTMLWNAMTEAVAKVTSEASPVADTFSKCQTLLTTQKTSNALTEKHAHKKPAPKRKNLHVIVGFGFGDDEISLLDSPSSSQECQ